MPIRLTVPSDPRVTNKAHLAFVLAVQCRFAEARQLIARGIEVASDTSFPVGPFSLCYARSMGASVEVIAGDVDAASAHTDVLLEVADRHGFTFWSVLGGFYDAYRDLRREVEGAAQRCEMALLLMQGVGVEVWLPYFAASVGAAQLAAGRLDEVGPRLAQGRAAAESTGAHYWTPELLRLEGVAALARGDESADGLLRAAVAEAVDRSATIHELWARTTLVERGADDAEREALATLVGRLAGAAPEPDLAAARAALG